MSGNVWEWTRSLWGTEVDEPAFKYPYKPDDGREDLRASDEIFRVLRGGAFRVDHRLARCASRRRGRARSVSFYVGFRVVVAGLP